MRPTRRSGQRRCARARKPPPPTRWQAARPSSTPWPRPPPTAAAAGRAPDQRDDMWADKTGSIISLAAHRSSSRPCPDRVWAAGAVARNATCQLGGCPPQSPLTAGSVSCGRRRRLVLCPFAASAAAVERNAAGNVEDEALLRAMASLSRHNGHVRAVGVEQPETDASALASSALACERSCQP